MFFFRNSTIRASNEIPYSHTSNGTMNIYISALTFGLRQKEVVVVLYRIAIAGFSTEEKCEHEIQNIIISYPSLTPTTLCDH